MDPYVPAVVRASVISTRLSTSVNVIYYGYSVISCILLHYLRLLVSFVISISIGLTSVFYYYLLV